MYGSPKGYSTLIPIGWNVFNLCIHLNSLTFILDGFVTSRMENFSSLSKSLGCVHPWSRCKCKPRVYRSFVVSNVWRVPSSYFFKISTYLGEFHYYCTCPVRNGQFLDFAIMMLFHVEKLRNDVKFQKK